MSSVPKIEDSTEKISSNLYDSDSDMSDTERLISERRRLNTEYMEQIEKERQELMQQVMEEGKDHLPPQEPKETTVTEDENDVEMKDVLNKSLEELEAERDAILQQVRNPEPPSVKAVPEATKVAEFEVPTRIKVHESIDNMEVKKKKNEKVVDVNGEISRLKTASESSTGESPSQVSKFLSILQPHTPFFMRYFYTQNYLLWKYVTINDHINIHNFCLLFTIQVRFAFLICLLTPKGYYTVFIMLFYQFFLLSVLSNATSGILFSE